MADFTRRCSNQAARRYLGPSRPRFTGGVTANLEVEANNFRRLILELDFRFPGLSHQIDGGSAMDSEIFQGASSPRSTPTARSI